MDGMIERPTYRALEEMLRSLQKECSDLNRMILLLLDGENKFRTFFENSLDALIISDETGRVLEANAAACAMFGYPEEELMRLGRDSLVDPDDPRRLPALRERERDGRFAGELNFKRGNGSTFPAEITSVLFRNKSGERRASIIIRDITRRRRMEDALKESEELYRTVFDHGEDGIVIVEPDTAAPIWFNKRACEQLGYTPEEFARLKIADIDLFEGPDEVEARIRKVIEKGYDEFETIHLARSGERRNILVKARYIPAGKRPLCHCIWRDITETKRREALEKRLQASQRMETVGTLAGAIAHDFNNALTGIIGFAALLREGLSGNEQALSDLDEVMLCSERAAMLTRQLLTYARRQVVEPVRLDLNRLVSDLVKFVSKLIGDRIEVRTALACGLPALHADVGEIEQVVMNLCLNARDAMPGGGSLTIGTEAVELDAEAGRELPEAEPGRYAVLTVSDTGTGMEKAVEERAFDPFFTTKGPGEGMGLGLSMVYGIVRRHGGAVRLSTEPGKGTTFRIYFPAAEGMDALVPAGPSEAIRGGTETILLAEDDEAARKIAERTLTGLGYTVLSAGDGEAAVDLFRGSSSRIDIALLDLVMPRKGGMDAFREMREIRGDLKAVFVSGYAAEDIRESFALNAGIPFLSKPFGPGVLARKVREVLDRD
ncbi:MAG: PAS domain S-box protein [Thermodesulfobacteriota bacterium]